MEKNRSRTFSLGIYLLGGWTILTWHYIQWHYKYVGRCIAFWTKQKAKRAANQTMLSELYIFFMSPHIGRFWSFSVCFPLTLGSLGWSYHVALRWSNLKMKNQQENNANLDKFSESSILIIPIFKLDYWRVYHFDWRESIDFQNIFMSSSKGFSIQIVQHWL